MRRTNFSVVLLVATSLTISTWARAGIAIDGIADPAYGSAISTQQLGTTGGVNTNTDPTISQGISSGSELDAAYGMISNGVLYLVLSGNLYSQASDEGGGTAPHAPGGDDYLSIFFMSDAGGTDHTLGTNYSATYNSRLDNMGVAANGNDPNALGLTFDSAFTPNYWIGVNVGEDENQDPTNFVFVDYQVVCSNCPSAFLGQVISTNSPPNVLTNVYFGNTIVVALNNSNTNGVDGTPCLTNAMGAAQSVAAAAVRSGVELAIPLGAIGNPTGQVRVCSFITDKYFENIWNQSLGPLSDGAGYCTNSLSTMDPTLTYYAAYVNFSTLPPGDNTHFFTIPVPPCDNILVNPTSASYASTGGVGSVTAVNFGGCAISVSSNASWLMVTSSSGLGSGNGSFTYSVATNANSATTRTGQFFVYDTDALGTIVTQTVTITQTGLPAPPLSAYFTIDGILDPAYGCPIVVQQLATQFGTQSTTNLQSNAGGSQLDAAYGLIQNNVLFLFLTGNLENNGNEVQIYFMTATNGVSTLSTNNNQTSVGGNPINALAKQGFTFDGGFAPNYWIGINGAAGPPYTLYFDYAQLWPSGTNAAGVATNGYYLGSTTSTNGTLFGGQNPFGVQGTINDSQTNGVNGGTCTTSASDVPEWTLATNMTTGIELGIPLGALGSPTGAIEICAILTGGSPHTYLSNQFLPPIATNDTAVGAECQANLANTANVNLTNYPGGPHFFLVGPEMKITSVTIPAGTTNVAVSFLTENNANIAYQVERSVALTNGVLETDTTSNWKSVGSLQFGNGGIVTVTDTKGGTNRPGAYYRVKQEPNGCP